eukprot:CAMPEP_0195525742 /NCGR_PEP_ID=MMETSP0794_2-20130614/26336_1 /TAXON_ID=515487 /ORGANISM="Stephanopyxis turris, Strain CCMP 815" /LENGTH=131 /DNA_ID=CAMNT_0040656263 /DNA_START=212 /DNA_END=607 /DNA_ORIENTATION=-
MFGGSGALEEEEDPEQEKQIAAAAKSMGFSVKEYKLVIKMQQNLQEATNALRVTGGSADKGVTVELDGNSPAKHVEVVITDEAKAMGKAALEKQIVSAIKDASEQAQKGQAAAIQKMNQDIATEMKGAAGQ